jgi:hypothetical protein
VLPLAVDVLLKQDDFDPNEVGVEDQADCTLFTARQVARSKDVLKGSNLSTESIIGKMT